LPPCVFAIFGFGVGFVTVALVLEYANKFFKLVGLAYIIAFICSRLNAFESLSNSYTIFFALCIIAGLLCSLFFFYRSELSVMVKELRKGSCPTFKGLVLSVIRFYLFFFLLFFLFVSCCLKGLNIEVPAEFYLTVGFIASYMLLASLFEYVHLILKLLGVGLAIGSIICSLLVVQSQDLLYHRVFYFLICAGASSSLFVCYRYEFSKFFKRFRAKKCVCLML
jgi:hypothetical protein